MEKIDCRATCTTCDVAGPDGTKPAHMVIALEPGSDQPDQVIFSGPHGADRAVEYARARYTSVEFRIVCDPGRIGLSGNGMRGSDADGGL